MLLFSTCNHLDKRDFGITSSSSFKERKSTSDKSSHSSRRISASSFSTKDENAVNIRFRREPQQIPRISVVLSKTHN